MMIGPNCFLVSCVSKVTRDFLKIHKYNKLLVLGLIKKGNMYIGLKQFTMVYL